MNIGTRPVPPARIFDPLAGPTFIAAPEIIEWARAVFIDEDRPLFNPVHAHLQSAEIGALWTNVLNERQQRRIIGMCEMPLQGSKGKWPRGREEMQLREWFGDGRPGWEPPDFVLTFDANYWYAADDAQVCCITEHELGHAGQAKDEFGQPRFERKTGRPIFAMRGHDVETFVFLTERYGPIDNGSRELVEAAKKPPLLKADMIGCACGTCELRKAA